MRKSGKKFYKNQQQDNGLQLKKVSGINQIVLIRHGEPDLKKVKWSNRKGAFEYTSNYDIVGVKPLDGTMLSHEKLSLVHVFSSPTQRALHTAQILFGEAVQIIVDRRFREFERKIFWFPGTDFYLPLKFWITFSRILWLLGFNSKGIETRASAYIRAKENAALLIEDAQEYGITVLVSHGFHNKVVLDFLKHQDWEVVRKGGNGYWATNILARESN